MSKLLMQWCLAASAMLTLALQPALAAPDTDGLQGPLASVGWLAKNLGRPDLLVLDASPLPVHRQGHIPGAVHANSLAFGPTDLPLAEVERRLRAWGVSPGLQVLIYDPGGTYMATRMFWDMVHHGLPAKNLLILDGGMAKWRASGGAVSKDPTPTPPPGTVSITTLNPEVRVKLPEFLAATGDPRANVMLEALDPSYYFGGAAFLDRGGHVPHATLMPAEDFYNADKTFKSPAEIERMLKHLGVRPEQQILTYCGGGGAAAVPFFALKYMLGYPQVKMFAESQLGWLRDERELPLWTYSAPHLARDTPWLKAWASPMLKAFGLSTVSVIDLRPAEAFKLGHIPLAVNLPMQAVKSQANDLKQLAALLGQAGVNPAHEAVLVSEGGLNENSALAFLLLERLGQHKVSVFTDSVERWAELGHDVARPAATPGPGQPTTLASAQAKPYVAAPRPDTLVTDPRRAEGLFPKVYVASGAQMPGQRPQGRVLHLPYAQFVGADGRPKAAKDIWLTLNKAGLPRYAEVVVFADSLGEAAVNYFIFRLMGFADVKVQAP